MSASLSAAGRSLPLDTPIVMGILNVTPDSFSDGGDHADHDAAIAAGLRMVADGAALVDVGGESTRPGAADVPAEQEMQRVVPVITALADAGITVSVDTSKAVVAEAALDAGAAIVNDVTALGDPDMAAVCARTGAGVVLMHMKGTPRTMQVNPQYDDVVSEIVSFLDERVATALAAGIRRDSIIVDPGIGFGKTVEHNLTIMRHLASIVDLGHPVLVGASRKRFLGALLHPLRGDTEPTERDAATLATVVVAALQGVRILRVHEVRQTVDVVTAAMAMVPSEAV